jgi:hypothetical protein
LIVRQRLGVVLLLPESHHDPPPEAGLAGREARDARNHLLR